MPPKKHEIGSRVSAIYFTRGARLGAPRQFEGAILEAKGATFQAAHSKGFPFPALLAP